MDARLSSTPLLAYVFWHWPSAEVAASNYEADLLRFHSSLASRPPAGLVRSDTFGVSGAPWLPERRESYEDWYLLRDWAALGQLNQDAVAHDHAENHDRVAAEAQAGAGALYGLRAGEDAPGTAVATWFAKPPDWSYAELDGALQEVLNEGFSLWRRLMVLGPAPEFCLRGSDAPPLRAPLQGLTIACRALR